MARITVMDFGKFQENIRRLADRDLAQINRKAVYKGAGIVADRIRENLERNLADPMYAGVNPEKKYLRKQKRTYTGDLLDSFGTSPIKQNEHGDTSTKIGFSGYDDKGVANALKARAMESGTSRLRKRPFVAPAVKATRSKAENAMRNVVETETTKILAL